MRELPPINPFVPGRGMLPPFLAGRDAEQQELMRLLASVRAGRGAPRDVVLSGPRGNGKTVLLRWLGREKDRTRTRIADPDRGAHTARTGRVGLHALPVVARVRRDRAAAGSWIDLDRRRFESLWSRSIGAGAVFDRLDARHGEPHRHYHTAAHVEHCLHELDLSADRMDEPDAVEIAVLEAEGRL